MTRYSVDPDIRKAHTLPGDFYFDAEAYAQLMEQAFARSWQWIGVRDAVPEPGRVFPFTFLQGAIDEPLLLTHDADGTVRCLSNVCTHRGNLLVRKAGSCKALRCRYHGRRFALDGQMEFMPEFEGVEGFPSDSDHLQNLPLRMLGRFLFTSLDPEFPFEDWLDGLRDRIGWLPIERFRLDSGRSKAYDFPANWALYVDHYLEGFHIPYVHKKRNSIPEDEQHETIQLPWGNLRIALARDGEPAFELPESSPDFGKRVAAYYFWFFPNLMLNFYPWGLSMNVVRPQGPGQTKVNFLTYVWKPQLLDSGTGSRLDRVAHEDEEIVLDMQKGLKSRLYDRGRYSPRMEQGVHQFHRLLCMHL